MSSIQFGGLISGLKTADIIDALMNVERQPLARVQSQEASLTAQRTAYGDLGKMLDDVAAKVKAFTTSSAGAGRSASSSGTQYFTATAGPTAAVGQHQVSVDRLATATVATSTGVLGTPLSLSVDPTKTLAQLNLASPVTAGQVTVTVDGASAQVAVGNPQTTTLQSVIDGLTNALQTQLGLTGDTATVQASIVGNQIQFAIVGGSGNPHTISFGDGDSAKVATALGLAAQGVTNGSNATITTSAYFDPSIASLNLAGSMTGGQVSAIVDGTIVHYTVGDPSTTSLTQLLNGFASAIQTQLRAGGTMPADPTATVTASVVGNRVQLGISTAASAHSLSFGAASDTSNGLSILGIASQSVSSAMNPTLTGASTLGVVRTTKPLDGAGLSSLVSTQTGKLTINGVDIAYDTTSDTLTSVITRINNSAAGVIASLDRMGDKLLLTRKDTGSLAIDIQDTGTLAAALKLAPGTTNAQIVGRTAQVTVDGRTVESTSNAVTNAIDGATISLTDETPVGETRTLTIGVDKSSITSAVQAFVSSFNALGDKLDSLTRTTPGQAGGTAGSSGPLASDPTALTMFLQLRNSLMHGVTIGGKTISLADIGITTGNVGAVVGSTSRLQVDTTKLADALDQNPTAVASLLNDPAGALQPLLDRVKALHDPLNADCYVQAHQDGLTSEINSLQRQETELQTRIDAHQKTLEAKYAALEALLSQLQTQSQAVTSQIASFAKP